MRFGNNRSNLFLLAALIADLGLMQAGRVTAQTFTILHGFTGGSDGASPYAGLVLSGDTLYGTTTQGGSSGGGKLFAVNADGTGFTNLHNFTALSGPSPGTNSDGAYPYGALMLSGNTLYGTTVQGGSSGGGTVFGLNTDGTGFTTLHCFADGEGGAPFAELILSGNTLYGTASGAGGLGQGTVFSLSLPLPHLTIVGSEANIILTWPTNATSFTLQSTTNLVSRAWTTNSPAPVVVNGQNTVTNHIPSTQQFFRLSQ